MHHAIAVGKELCLGLVWGMFIVFFQISAVIIYEYPDISAFKFFAALHPYNLSVMIRVEPFARPRSYCCRYDEQLAAEKQRTERVTKRILTKEEMPSSVPLSTMPAVRSQKKLETLMAGGCIVERVDENLTYDYLHASEDNLWSTLYLTGYGHACRHSSHIERHPA